MKRIGFWFGPILMFLGLFGVAIFANPWGVPAVQPWFTISGLVGGTGTGILIAELSSR